MECPESWRARERDWTMQISATSNMCEHWTHTRWMSSQWMETYELGLWKLTLFSCWLKLHSQTKFLSALCSGHNTCPIIPEWFCFIVIVPTWLLLVRKKSFSLTPEQDQTKTSPWKPENIIIPNHCELIYEQEWESTNNDVVDDIQLKIHFAPFEISRSRMSVWWDVKSLNVVIQSLIKSTRRRERRECVMEKRGEGEPRTIINILLNRHCQQLNFLLYFERVDFGHPRGKHVDTRESTYERERTMKNHLMQSQHETLCAIQNDSLFSKHIANHIFFIHIRYHFSKKKKKKP